MIKSRRLRWARHVTRMNEGRNAFKILTGKPRGKRPLRGPRRRWEDNMRMDLLPSTCDVDIDVGFKPKFKAL
jgi:hypothetical protein